MTTGKVWVYRKEGIPVGTSKEDLHQAFPIDIRHQIKVTSLSPGIDLNQRTLTATFSFDTKPGEKHLVSEDKDFYGFTPLYTPPADIETDIIAVTGLAGHAFGSWAASPNMWLRDFVPNDLPKARVLLYGYNSNLAGNQSKNIISDFSNNFVVKFHTMRNLSRSRDRPIVLIGHSLGCLIIKDALIEMSSHPIHLLSQSMPVVKAVIFFGAPHRGLNITAMQSILKSTPSAELIRELGWQSPTMQKLNDGFRHLSEGLNILSIYEKRPTATLRKSERGVLERTGPPEMMVEKDSALVYQKMEISIGLDQDHSKISKVDRGQTGCYDEIIHFIGQSISFPPVQREFQQRHCESSSTQSAPPTDTTALKPLFLVPFSRDGSFINRINIFNHVNRLSEQHHRIALSGIGGIGKSQLAIEYCYRFRDDHPHAQIFWVHASTKQRFDQAYSEVARKLELSGWDDPNINTLRLVTNWFNETANESWLLVLDNADDSGMVYGKSIPTANDSETTLPFVEYLPHSSKGLTLITTRDTHLAKRLVGMHASIVVNPMSPQEAQELFGNWQKYSPDSSDEDQSGQLLEALGYIPLAITQAAAFIDYNYINVSQYLEMFHKSDSDLHDLLNEDLGDLRRDSESYHSVMKTWKISFDMIQKQKPHAAEMLSLMACLDRQGIPESLLRDDSDRQIDVTMALGVLLAFSLIKTGNDRAWYELHRLVQLATQNWLEMQGMTQRWQGKALVAVSNEFPYSKFETWPRCGSLLPHAQKVIQYGDGNGTFSEELSIILAKVADYHLDQGQYEKACVGYLTAIGIQKKCLGLEHKNTLDSMNNLALAQQRQGQLGEAGKLYFKVLDVKKQVLGVEHPSTLTTMNNLAILYQEQYRWEEAEKLQIQVLKGQKALLRLEHPSTLHSTHNLAAVYRNRGRLEEVEELLIQVLDARRRMLGTEHPNTLNSISDLAGSYIYKGRLEEAEKLQVEAMRARIRVLGAEHPDSLTSMDNLALIYNAQARYEEAKALNEQVLEARKRVLGAEHPDTLIIMNNLALIYDAQERYEDAEALHVQVLEARKRVLAAEHPDTLVSMNNLATSYREQARYEEAEALQIQVLEARKRVVGAEHPDTLTIIALLAITYCAQARYEEAEALHMQVLEARKRVLGPEHRDTVRSMHNLAVFWSDRNRQKEAIPLMESVVELHTKTLGADHPNTRKSAGWLKKWLGT